MLFCLGTRITVEGVGNGKIGAAHVVASRYIGHAKASQATLNIDML